jgi:hypothetical protein
MIERDRKATVLKQKIDPSHFVMMGRSLEVGVCAE